MAFVEFHDVTKQYGTGEQKTMAADHINFTFEEGEFVVIVGPSGAGKTTVLNMLGGMDTVTSGTILMDGDEISAYNERQLTTYRRHDVGFVFQFYNLVPNLTALENVELSSQICDHPLDPEQVLTDMGLADRMDHFPAQLSGGEQQRVSIARALSKNPKLLLCDEPTGALDYKTGKMILVLLHETCRSSGRTVVIITHNQAFKQIADRVITIQSGRVTSNTINPYPLPASEIEW